MDSFSAILAPLREIFLFFSGHTIQRPKNILGFPAKAQRRKEKKNLRRGCLGRTKMSSSRFHEIRSPESSLWTPEVYPFIGAEQDSD
jgi:hypothetical protein